MIYNDNQIINALEEYNHRPTIRFNILGETEETENNILTTTNQVLTTTNQVLTTTNQALTIPLMVEKNNLVNIMNNKTNLEPALDVLLNARSTIRFSFERPKVYFSDENINIYMPTVKPTENKYVNKINMLIK